MMTERYEIVCLSSIFFFFQAEDGIRDVAVTGVQTCALPIYRGPGLEPGEQPGCGRAAQRHLRPSILPLGRRRDLPAREVGDELHAVADAEDRDAEFEQLRIGARRARVEHGVGTARENDPLGGELADEREIARRGMDLAVDVRLAHAPRDQLRVLRSVVENQDPVHAWYQVVGSSTSPRSRSSSVSRCRAR